MLRCRRSCCWVCWTVLLLLRAAWLLVLQPSLLGWGQVPGACGPRGCLGSCGSGPGRQLSCGAAGREWGARGGGRGGRDVKHNTDTTGTNCYTAGGEIWTQGHTHCSSPGVYIPPQHPTSFALQCICTPVISIHCCCCYCSSPGPSATGLNVLFVPRASVAVLLLQTPPSHPPTS